MKKSPTKIILSGIVLLLLCNLILATEVELGGGMGVDITVIDSMGNVSSTTNNTSQNYQATSQEPSSHKNSNTKSSSENKEIEILDNYVIESEKNITKEKILLNNKQKMKGGYATITLLFINSLLSIIFLFFLVRIVQMKSSNGK